MIIDERMSAFIDSLDSGNPAWLNEIEKYALDTQVPIIRRSMQSLLKFLLTYTKPKSILEVGTAIGFSALLMSEYAPADCPITTIEKYEKRIPIAKDNFRKAGREDRITLLEGDATEILKELEGTYDIIFMDAAKGQYINFLPDILRLLSPGGLLISDNVLQDGDIIESRFAVTRRNRTIHARMREYLYELKHHPELETVILPVGDGVTLSTKAVRGENKDEKCAQKNCRTIESAGYDRGRSIVGSNTYYACVLHSRKSDKCPKIHRLFGRRRMVSFCNTTEKLSGYLFPQLFTGST